MALVHVKDADGNIIQLVEVDGYRIGTFLQSHETVAESFFRDIIDIPCREDDIFICGPIKSGTHWTWEIISMMCNGNADTIKKSKKNHMLEASPWAELAAIPSPRVLNTHLNYRYLPREIKEKRCKIVLPLRNPKDVAVSYYKHLLGLLTYKYVGKWEHFLPLFLDGQLEYNSWFDNVKEWEELITNKTEFPIHVVYYEDLKEKSLEEVYRLGEFLGIENKDDLYKRVSEKCQFQNMKKDKAIPEEDNLFRRPEFSFYRKAQSWSTLAIGGFSLFDFNMPLFYMLFTSAFAVAVHCLCYKTFVMALVEIRDRGGDTMELVEVDGYRLCTFWQPAEVIAERFRNMVNFPCREDDIFICAPVKSGTHWTWEIISMLCNGNTETIPKTKVHNMLEATPGEDLLELKSPRVLNTHLNWEYMPREMKDKKCKIVFPLRNPKDMIVSYFHHSRGIGAYKYDGKWENFLPMVLDGELDYNSWFDYMKEWEEIFTNHPELPIHVVYYEDLKENCLEEVYRLGKFLGIENKDNLYERISEKCQFKNMQKDKEYPKEQQSLLFKHDFSLYRKGEIGDWKNYFTVAQNEQFDKVYADKMKNSKLKFRYEYRK